MEVKCSSKLSCSSGCNVGYKCGTDGCPTCDCIKPQSMYNIKKKSLFTGFSILSIPWISKDIIIDYNFQQLKASIVWHAGRGKFALQSGQENISWCILYQIFFRILSKYSHGDWWEISHFQKTVDFRGQKERF